MARVKADVRREVERLRHEIQEHDHRYYVLDDPTISDAEYDDLFRRLEAFEKEHPELAWAARRRRSSGRSATATRCCRSPT
jgi:DNA ligase (NAD+)